MKPKRKEVIDVEKILSETDWAGYARNVEAALAEHYRCKCKDCERIQKEMKKSEKLTRLNVAKALVEIQDYGGIDGNVIATKWIKKFGLRKEHQQITKNPDSAYDE